MQYKESFNIVHVKSNYLVLFIYRNLLNPISSLVSHQMLTVSFKLTMIIFGLGCHYKIRILVAGWNPMNHLIPVFFLYSCVSFIVKIYAWWPNCFLTTRHCTLMSSRSFSMSWLKLTGMEHILLDIFLR